jgi:hypothetical protein
VAPPGRDAYQEWAAALLAAMALPRLALRPGTIRPEGAQVADLVTAEYGARIVVDLSTPAEGPPMVADGIMAGCEVEVDSGGWTVDLVLGVDGPVRTS